MKRIFVSLDPRARAVFEGVRGVCEWRLGRADLGDGGKPSTVIGLEAVITALRTIMKSVQRWSERGGKRGYLDFVKAYLP